MNQQCGRRRRSAARFSKRLTNTQRERHDMPGTSDMIPDGTTVRADELAAGARNDVARRSDRLFAGLLVFQYVIAIALAIWVSPLTWAGAAHTTHPHVWVALLLG